jgi:hypothetical protein
MINKEASFNKIFNNQPLVGIVNPARKTQQAKSIALEKNRKSRSQPRLPPLLQLQDTSM